MVESKLLFCSLKQALEFWVRQPGYGNDVSAPVFSNIYHKMAFRDIIWQTIVMVMMETVPPPKTRTLLEDLFQGCRLCSTSTAVFCCFLDSHFEKKGRFTKRIMNLEEGKKVLKREGKGVVLEGGGGDELKGKAWGSIYGGRGIKGVGRNKDMCSVGAQQANKGIVVFLREGLVRGHAASYSTIGSLPFFVASPIDKMDHHY